MSSACCAGAGLAKHGALADRARSQHPAAGAALFRVASSGTIQRRRRLCGAFQDIGPAAIKLGQTLATPATSSVWRPLTPASLQDRLPPVPFAAIRAESRQSSQGPHRSCSPSRSLGRGFGLDRAGPQGGTTEGRTGAVKVLSPAYREKFARDIETYAWAAAHLEALGGEAARLRRG